MLMLNLFQLEERLPIVQKPKKAWREYVKPAKESSKLGDKGDNGSDEDQEEPVSLCKRLMLVSTLFGMEMCMSFEQIYQILLLCHRKLSLSLKDPNNQRKIKETNNQSNNNNNDDDDDDDKTAAASLKTQHHQKPKSDR
ncbi:hypothetical protein PoB_004559100 [Plakobranchus ocellatus]|uniref:Uncharacterized protein n=1 Tax=Plakobranchus ocellatus TaxID=259542 RepID=A0AAV4BF79_9GAST|nr:hypothetical protein PoB_004559100 [Plakobranchus ocellatus]